MTTLAQCMIVKNEEKYLPYCLASIYKSCDEIIVVDTGSSDRTIEIAEAFGAYVIQAPWANDFSLVRNISQSCAKSDWIVWLDGDEVFSSKGIQTIKNRLATDNGTFFYYLPRVNFWKDMKHMFLHPDSQYKIYKNHMGFKWTGNIHERIYNDSNTEHRNRMRHLDVTIFHYAYVKTPEEVKNKMKLYIKIENPGFDNVKLDRCSTEHSFFFNKLPEGVQEYNGDYPEIFNQVQVTDSEILMNGTRILKFGDRKSVSIPSDRVFEAPKVEQKQDVFLWEPGLVSIVIATYNKLEYLKPCIESVYSSTKEKFELIVVDNGSTEMNMTDYLSGLTRERSNVKVFRFDENKGFSAGYNKGVEMSRGEWVCVLNNDTLVTEDWITKFIGHMKEHPNYGIVGPVSNLIHGENQLIHAREGAAFGEYITIVDGLIKNGGKKFVESSWITGCVMFFHRSLLKELSKITNPPYDGILFDPIFGYGQGEDGDLVYRVQHRVGKKVGVARDVLIFHEGSKTLSGIKDWQKLQEDNNKILRQRWPEIFPNK